MDWLTRIVATKRFEKAITWLGSMSCNGGCDAALEEASVSAQELLDILDCMWVPNGKSYSSTACICTQTVSFNCERYEGLVTALVNFIAMVT